MPEGLNGRVRTLRALDYESTDRVPVVGGFVRHPRFLVLAAGTTVDGFWADPEGAAIRAFRNLGVDCIVGLILPSADSASGAQVDIHKQTRFASPEAMLDDIARLPSLTELRRTFDFQKEYAAYLALYRDGQAAVGDDILWMPNTFHCVAQFQNEIYIRHVKRSLEPLKDAGIRILWHSDGNIMPIVPYLLDAGVDGFQGLQETIETRIDVAALRELKTREGRPPVIAGSVSSVTTMPFGTPKDVRADVHRCQTLAAAKGGGWLLNFSSSLGPEVPEDNIQAFFGAAIAASPPDEVGPGTPGAGEGVRE